MNLAFYFIVKFLKNDIFVMQKGHFCTPRKPSSKFLGVADHESCINFPSDVPSYEAFLPRLRNFTSF